MFVWQYQFWIERSKKTQKYLKNDGYTEDSYSTGPNLVSVGLTPYCFTWIKDFSLV